MPGTAQLAGARMPGTAPLPGADVLDGDLADGGLAGHADDRGVNLAVARADTCDGDLAEHAFWLAINAGSAVQGGDGAVLLEPRENWSSRENIFFIFLMDSP